MNRDLEQEGRLTNPRVAPNQNQAAGYHPATQYPVELLEIGMGPRFSLVGDFFKTLSPVGAFAALGQNLKLTFLGLNGRLDNLLFHLIPSATIRTLAQILGRFVAAGHTFVAYFFLGHSFPSFFGSSP